MRENEATPSAATAIPVNSNTLAPGGAPSTSRGTGGRSGASAAAPAAPAGERRRRARPRPFSRGLYGVLLKLIDAAKHLSPRDRIRLLTGVLLVAALIVIVAVGDHIPPQVIVLYALVSATLVMIVGKTKDGGIRQAALILTFALVYLVAQGVDTLFGAGTRTRAVPGPAQYRQVIGRVVDESGGRPLANVFVRVRGDSRSTPTDSLGRFRLDVLEKSIRNDSVVFCLTQGTRGDTVSQSVADAEITLVFSDRVARAGPGERVLQPEVAAAVPLALVSRPGGAGTRWQSGALAVIVDSIYALNDGTGMRGAEWSFDVKVTDATPIHVSKSYYSERELGRLMLVGSETDVPARVGDTVTITVDGVREIFFWKYRVRGSRSVAYGDVPPDRPLRLHVMVQDGNRTYNGQFQFFLTVLRLPGRLAPG